MSKIEVDAITEQSGSTLTAGGGAGKTVVVDATTVTLGRCGGTVALASGASQSGFGRTGTVNWQTTPKTATFTAVNGEGYFINSGSAITANLPAGSAGAIVAFSDYARNFATYNLTISPDGSEKIGGIAQDATLDVNGQAATFVYVDATKGWVNVQNAEDTETGVPPFISATGGTITCSGDYKIHTFTGPGTFTVTNAGTPAGSTTVDYLVVAGGAGGGAGGGPSGFSGAAAGAGGAGGYRESSGTASGSYTISPLGACVSALPVSLTSYPIVVGGGGAGAARVTAPTIGVNGSISSGLGITSTGGGAGAGWTTGSGQPGGSGGGPSSSCSVGIGNTPPVSPPQGNPSGTTPSTPSGNVSGGGGGGATGAGQVGTPGPTGNNPVGGVGGIGGTSSITGSPVGYAGGGGGGAGGDPPYTPTNSVGGSATQGGGAGGSGLSVTGVAGTTNTGGGGGGGAANPGGSGGAGGSGIVIIRYKFQ
jgi:hypothetical protein